MYSKRQYFLYTSPPISTKYLSIGFLIEKSDINIDYIKKNKIKY